MDGMQILTDLHDSEMNGEIAWFYDGAWTATLGDPVNGKEKLLERMLNDPDLRHFRTAPGYVTVS